MIKFKYVFYLSEFVKKIISLMRVFAVMEEFVMGREHDINQERQELLDTIINSNFFEDYFRRQLTICPTLRTNNQKLKKYPI